MVCPPWGHFDRAQQVPNIDTPPRHASDNYTISIPDTEEYSRAQPGWERRRSE